MWVCSECVCVCACFCRSIWNLNKFQGRTNTKQRRRRHISKKQKKTQKPMEKNLPAIKFLCTIVWIFISLSQNPLQVDLYIHIVISKRVCCRLAEQLLLISWVCTSRQFVLFVSFLFSALSLPFSLMVLLSSIWPSFFPLHCGCVYAHFYFVCCVCVCVPVLFCNRVVAQFFIRLFSFCSWLTINWMMATKMKRMTECDMPQWCWCDMTWQPMHKNSR